MEEKNTAQPVVNQNQVSKPAIKSKLPLIIIVFIFIIALGFGAYYLGAQSKNINQQKQASVIPTNIQNSPTPTIDETANPDQIGASRKTYTNEVNDTEWGFYFKIPTNWSAIGNDYATPLYIPKEGKVIVHETIVIPPETEGIPGSLTIKRKSIDQAIQRREKELIDAGYKVNTIDFILPSGQQVKKLSFVGEGQIGYDIFASKDLYSYHFVGFSSKSKVSRTFDQILSTFKFTESGGAVVSPSSTSNKTVTVPSDWKQYTAEDWQFKIKTTMFMLPGFSFSFTGSEFSIQNSNTTELWDFSTSVYIKELEATSKNHYNGSSRRVWYENYLAEKQKNFSVKDKILNVTEIPLNNTSYLKIFVEAPAYNDRGEISGKKTVTHYLYVQNNIVNIITPVSLKANSSDADIPKNIGTIFASLNSQQTK